MTDQQDPDRPCSIEIGKTYEVTYPFIRTTVRLFDEDGGYANPTWAPGIEYEMSAPDDSQPVAHGFGKMLLRVISVHELPKPYKPRIYFVRQWVDPGGHQFGKTNLRILGIQAFRRRLAGYHVDDEGTEVKLSEPSSEPHRPCSKCGAEIEHGVIGQTLCDRCEYERSQHDE